jgi:hypothetical protein
MSGSVFDDFPDWQRRILLLRESAWRDADINSAKVDDWLRNFKGEVLAVDVERRHAIHLLQQFIYFGRAEITECLHVLFRDHFVYPTVQELKRTLSEPQQIAAALTERVEKETVFVGVGLPAESGTHMLYTFRAVNDLQTLTLLSLDQIFFHNQDGNVGMNPPTLKHLVFIDDLCGSGDQIVQRTSENIRKIREWFPSLKITYFVLIATADGLDIARKSQLFDVVEAAITFDADYKAFGENSLCYREQYASISSNEGRQIAEGYGQALYPKWPLGHKDCQLLFGFEHNTPDNTLPIFWHKDSPRPWFAIFPRVIKK